MNALSCEKRVPSLHPPFHRAWRDPAHLEQAVVLTAAPSERTQAAKPSDAARTVMLCAGHKPHHTSLSHAFLLCAHEFARSPQGDPYH